MQASDFVDENFASQSFGAFYDSLSRIYAICKWQRAGNMDTNCEGEFPMCQSLGAIPVSFVIREACRIDASSHV